MEGSYDPLLVALSIAVACLAAYTALSMVDRIRAARTVATARAWLFAGGFAMGGGVWAMHFTAMTAFSMGMPTSYGLGLTLVSIVPVVLGSTVALHYLSQNSLGWSHLVLGGLLLAVGIGAMHYVGMEAMRMPAIMVYDPWLFALSIAAAFALATISLYVKFVLARSWIQPIWSKIASAGVLGVAVAAMHYTAMAAASFHHDPATTVEPGTFSSATLGVSICGVMVLVLGLALIGTIVDRRLEEAAARLEDSEAWAEAVLNTATDCIVAIGSSGTVVGLNRAAERTFGCSQEDVLGTDASELFAMTSDAEGVQMILHANGGGAGETSYQETVGTRRDGATFPLEIGVGTLKRGEDTLWIASARDITVRKNLESQLLQAQKLESIGQLAAGIAHEINTPIQFVVHNAQFLEEAFCDLQGVLDACGRVLDEEEDGKVDPALVSAAREAVEIADLDYLEGEIPSALAQAREGLSRVSRIVLAMKNFSHPGSSDKTPIDLNESIDSTVTICRAEWKHLAEVEMDLDPALPSVPCLGAEINQAVLNIVVNAAHAIGSSQADGCDSKGLIQISTRAVDGYAEIRISDDGSGMPPDVQERIFDPFFTTKEVGKGTGQGLTVAHSVIHDKHDGTIRVESEVGKGTTFVIRLPLGAEGSEGASVLAT